MKQLYLSIAWSPDGQRIASGSYDHFVKVWNAKSGALERSLGAHEDAVSAVDLVYLTVRTLALVEKEADS